MKTAIYIEDGFQQVVLQAEDTFEQNVLKAIQERSNEVEFFYGSFSTCEGGWIRRYREDESSDSLMLFIKPSEPGKEAK